MLKAMHLLITLLLMSLALLFCKPVTSKTTTSTLPPHTYDMTKMKYDMYFHQHQGTLRLKYMQQLEAQLQMLLQHNQLEAAKKLELSKMLHKVRSFISYAKLSGCLEKDEEGNYRATEKTSTLLCSVILYKMKELDYHQIDLNQPNAMFFFDDSSIKHDEQELFAALNKAILATTIASMHKYLRIFPFADNDIVGLCKTKNTEFVYVPVDVTRIPPSDYVIKNPDLAPPPFPATSYPQKPQKNDNCQQLAAELQKEKVPQPNEKTFASVVELQATVNSYVLRLNATIDRLDRLIHGADGERAATKKESIFIFPIANVVDFSNENVVNAYDDYAQILLATARDGLLPLMMLYYQNKLHLNIKGAWGGLKAMQYEPLDYPLSRKLEEHIVSLHEYLVTRWLELKENLSRAKEEKDKKIYELLVNNDIATARLIMQDPAYSLPVTRLLAKYQNDHRAPKWLQLLKSWSYRLDMLFIPLTIAATIVSGGVAFPLVAGIAVSINFFWIGATGAEAHLARKRYAMMEHALLSGNSTQVERGAKLLHEFHDKRRNLVLAGTVGAPLSVPSLKMAMQGVVGLKTVAIDMSAAFASDVDGLRHGGGDLDLLGRFDDKSDAELLQGH